MAYDGHYSQDSLRGGMKMARRIPNFFNKEQITKLFDAIQEPDVMISVFLALFCGLRVGEVVRLRKCDFDFEKRFLKIINSKNPNRTSEGYGKDRLVSLPQHLIVPLKMWLEIVGDTEFIFPSISLQGEHIGLQHLEKKYWVALRKAGLREVERVNTRGINIYKYNFHTLRHTYATLLWEKTGDIYAVKNALGHSKVRTTEIYTHVNNKFLQEKIDTAFSPKYAHFEIQQNGKEAQSFKQTDSAMDILKIRLAKGEISILDYQKTMNALNVCQKTVFGIG